MSTRVRMMRGLRVLFLEEETERMLSREIAKASLIVVVASFFLFLYVTFVRGWYVVRP